LLVLCLESASDSTSTTVNLISRNSDVLTRSPTTKHYYRYSPLSAIIRKMTLNDYNSVTITTRGVLFCVLFPSVPALHLVSAVFNTLRCSFLVCRVAVARRRADQLRHFAGKGAGQRSQGSGIRNRAHAARRQGARFGSPPTTQEEAGCSSSTGPIQRAQL
jgi:hypothetical protein